MTVVVIDGPAGSGKSTVARAVAQRLGLEVLDTGAMYRAVTWAVLERGHDPSDAEAAESVASSIRLEMLDGRVSVDGTDVTEAIRTPRVSDAVSAVSAHPAVRHLMLPRQRAWAEAHGGGVAEGRDMGTVVFPAAEVKVFLDASPQERARRRAAELATDDRESVEVSMLQRDHLDSTRAASPLRAADDALRIDTSAMTVDEVVDRVVEAAGRAAADSRGRRATRRSAPPLDHHVDVERGWRARALYRIIRTAAVVAAKGYWRLEVIGADRIPAHGGFVFAPVHRSNIDFMLPALATRRRIRWMAKHTIFKGGLIDRFLVALGAFPTDRERTDREALRTCERLLAHGEGVVMFPEGRRRQGPRVEHLFDGPAFCAARERVPIVPMAIGGSDRVMPIGSKFVWPRKVVLIVGEPIYPDVPLTGRVPRSHVAKLTGELETALQELYDRAVDASS